MVLGYFGRTPVEPDPEIVKIAEEQLKMPVFKGDPLDILEPGIPKAKAILEKEGLPVTDENIFTVGALATPGGNKGLDFLKGKATVNVRKITKKDGESEKKAAAKPAPARPEGPVMYKVTVDGTTHEVWLKREADKFRLSKPVLPDVLAAPEPAIEVRAKLPGNVYEVFCAVGDRVKKGETLAYS